jgi:hypothetical protein
MGCFAPSCVGTTSLIEITSLHKPALHPSGIFRPSAHLGLGAAGCQRRRMSTGTQKLLLKKSSTPHAVVNQYVGDQRDQFAMLRRKHLALLRDKQLQ